MGAIRTAADAVYDDYNTTGVAASGAKRPSKTDIRGLFGSVEDAIDDVASDVALLQAGIQRIAAVDAATVTTLPACTYANGTSGVGAALTGNSNGALSAQDGVTLTSGQRLCVKDQASGAQNGFYSLTQVGDASHPFILTRATDADTAAELSYAAAYVKGGTVNTGRTYVVKQASAAITVGSTSLVIVEESGPEGVAAETVRATAAEASLSDRLDLRDNIDLAASTDISASVGSPTFNYDDDIADQLYVAFTASTNQAIRWPGKCVVGQRYRFSAAVTKQSGTYAPIQVGNFLSTPNKNSGVMAVSASSAVIACDFVAETTDLNLGVLGADNSAGVAYSFTGITVSHVDDAAGAIRDGVYNDAGSTSLIRGRDVDMLGKNAWADSFGTPALAVNESGHEGLAVFAIASGVATSVKLPGVFSRHTGKRGRVKIDVQKLSGTDTLLTIGFFSSGASPGKFTALATSAMTTFEGDITITGNDLEVGAIAADAHSCTVAFTNITLVKIGDVDNEIEDRLLALESSNSTTPAAYSRTDQFLQSLSKYESKLVKIGVAGDSLMANDVGGTPGAIESSGEVPIRLDCNSIARRIYDLLSWNKATHRSLEHSAWTKSGTWGSVNDSTVWEPGHTATQYHESTTSGAYAEIVVPSGQENFALIVQKDAGFDTLTVTLNGGSIASYGPSTIALARSRTGTGDIGNPFYTVEYLGLPAGANTIRVSKGANTNKARVWGGFWWTGTTMVVHNVAHGGHTMNALLTQGHFQAEVIENNFDAILFEVTTFNEAGTRTLVETKADLQTIISDLSGKDVMFITPYPFGTDPNTPFTNYYTTYSDPDLEEISAACVSVLGQNGVPYIDCFSIFKKKIENRGGTLAGGESGGYYTTDGQHPSTAGMLEWYNVLRAAFVNKPILY